MDNSSSEHDEGPLPFLKHLWDEQSLPDPTPDDQPDLETVRVLEWVATAWHSVEIPAPEALPSPPTRGRVAPTHRPWAWWTAVASIAAAAILGIYLIPSSSLRGPEPNFTEADEKQATVVTPDPLPPSNPAHKPNPSTATTVLTGAVVTPRANGVQIQNGPVRLLLIQKPKAN